MPNVKLQSGDGEVFEVEPEIAKCSNTIKTMMDDLGIGKDCKVVIPLANVHSSILQKIIEWATFHLDDPAIPAAPKPDQNSDDDICEWDRQFLPADHGTFFELILAANYLEIPGLLALTCKTVANMIKVKTPNKIRDTFNIENDLTPEEEMQIRRENELCEELRCTKITTKRRKK